MRYYQCEKYPVEFVMSENIDKHFAPHNHAGHYIVSVVMQGEVRVCLEGRETVCHRGDTFIIPPYALHSVGQEKDARLLSMCIGTTFVEETDRETADGIFRKLLGDAVGQGIFAAEQQEKLLACLETVYSLRDQGQKEMDAGIKILADKIIGSPEQELPIEALAADIFLSKYYLIRRFKNNIGLTPHQFRIQNRIRKAQRLLDAEQTIGRIAAETGFYDQSHFDRAFQRIVGISPSEYVDSKRRMKGPA